MRIPVGILGVTGLVGRRILARLSDHPWFEVVEAGASEASVGLPLSGILEVARRERAEDGTAGRVPADGGVSLRGNVRSLEGEWTAPLLVSALPSAVARTVERRLADAGHLIVSNASAFRADPSVPLVIPEVNPDHLELVDDGGGIVTNPNCSVAAFMPALAPLHRAFGVERLMVTTFQAVSGAGASGPTTLALLDNVLPFIPGEEEKVEREPRKILGSIRDGSVAPAEFAVSATTTRVPVLHGHLVDLSIRFTEEVGTFRVREVLEAAESRVRLPSVGPHPVRVVDESDRPQPRIDRGTDGGMAVTVGRLRACPVNHVRFLALAHNLERGAAGAAVANAELCRVRGLIPGFPAMAESGEGA